MDKECRGEDVCALAELIAERIVHDPLLSGPLVQRLGAWYTCPPGELCCEGGYGCNKPFVCRPGFDCTRGFATYPF